ncbi:MAG: diguanylate cyclase [Methylobacter sp.]
MIISKNHRYGHKTSDEVLLLIARQLPEQTRAIDFIFRFGGEEFTMLLPNTHEQSALIVANQLRQAIEQRALMPAVLPLPLPFPAALLSLLKAILMRLHLIVQTALFIRLKIRVATNVV